MPRKKKIPDAQEVEISGITYYSKCQAQFGVLLDELGESFFYFPKRIRLLNGTYFSPTFLIEDVLVQGQDREYILDKLYIKVNGMRNTPAATIKAIVDDPDLHVLFVEKVPFGSDMGWVDTSTHERHEKLSYMFSFKTIDGQDTVACMGLNKDAEFKLFRPDVIYPFDRDEDMTFDAYKTALSLFMKEENIEKYFGGDYEPNYFDPVCQYRRHHKDEEKPFNPLNPLNG